MTKVSGYYQCSIDTPMGAQQFLLTVKAEDQAFHGQVAGAMGGDSGALKVDGTVDGNVIAWTMAVPKPMPITLTCRAAIDGDRLEGKVKAGIFGSYPITGTRTDAPQPL